MLPSDWPGLHYALYVNEGIRKPVEDIRKKILLWWV
jgi:hypothetical protein